AGVTAIGARPPLVAYNIYLDTSDVAAAKEIAKRIRTSSGGLPAVQASGFAVNGQAQVSMNLLDIDTTPPARVFAAVEAAARERGVEILRSEVVGLIPERAIIGAGAAYLKLSDATDHLLEAKIRAAEGEGAGAGGGPTLDGWLADLAGGTPPPGGGSAAGLAGARAARARRARGGGRERARERAGALGAGVGEVAGGGGGGTNEGLGARGFSRAALYAAQKRAATSRAPCARPSRCAPCPERERCGG